MKGLVTFLSIFLFYLTAFGQQYTDSVYRPNIKSIELYNQGKAGSLPVINLNSGDKLVLGFDDLTGQTSNFYYTLEHCDALWNSSRLSPAEYLQGFTEDQIINYKYSSGTYQKYVHYEIIFPNSNIIPKYAGNYILKVYEDGDQQKLVFTRKLYVLNSRVTVAANVVPSNNVQYRQTNQKLNFTVDYGQLRIQNPATDMRVIVMQNYRADAGILNREPMSIRGTQLVYNDVNANDFPGRNEFRYFDMRSLKAGAHGINRIYRDTGFSVQLNTDVNRNGQPYEFQFDNNGNYFILNQDGSDPRVDADYARVYFSLDARKSAADGTPYIIGRFNNFKPDAGSMLKFDAATGRFTAMLQLKQGVYDYGYLWVNNTTKKADDTVIEGSHYETGNDYQLFIYYRPPGARWEELAGLQQISTAKNQNR
ncbi:DUF5103 domain-containing protein [Mucilaginibacter sp. UR6-1]|uniref:type IX secretion system plug protein n=1 Tax=Mucilaginibacter sp. UR6-1 TaxID=1435643 RepID=UPI001E33F178|nr:DUF5103 domain-containing protein [Mucilaginibacter sp. UR6-1]MCC8408963.1 DUF5103 domain-containing protein [Mucilaginibacter sp. UR6-1]